MTIYVNNENIQAVGGAVPSGKQTALQLDDTGNLLVALAGSVSYPAVSTTQTLTGTATANLNVKTMADIVTAVISGAWTGTLYFQGSTDNINFISIQANNGSNVTSTTVNGTFTINSTGYSYIQISGTGITGTATIAWSATSTLGAITNTGAITVQGMAGGTAIPITGTISATNPSVGTNAAAIPTSSTLIAGTNAGNLQPIAVTAGGSISIATANTTATGALGALNAAVSVAMVGLASVGMQLAAGTLVGTITPQCSIDGGVTWNNTYFDLPNGTIVSTFVFGSSNTATVATILGVGGATNVRVTVTAYTSGTANITLAATQVSDPTFMSAGPAGSALPPTTMVVGGSDGTLVRNILTSATGQQVVIGAGTAGAASGGIITVQGVASMTPMLISGTGTAGVPGTAVLTVQGIASGTALPASQGAGSGAAATYWYQRVTDGTNTLPTMDVAARRGFITVTDGTNSMPTMDAVARKGFIAVTDGTNTSAVKAASTAAAAADPSLVVAISPNINGSKTSANSIPVVIASDQATVAILGANVTATGTLASATTTTAVAMNGQQSASFQLSSSLVGTLVPQYSQDGGTSYVTGWFYNPATQSIVGQSLVLGVGTLVDYTMIVPPGTTHVRVNCSAYTSGSSTYFIYATAASDQVKFDSSIDGNKATYSASVSGLAVVTGATDVLTIYGSASKTIRIMFIELWGSAASGVLVPVSLIVRSAVNTGGTSGAVTAVPHDSKDAAASATVLSYTANATGLGTAVGNVRNEKLFFGVTTGTINNVIYTFGGTQMAGTKGLVLRGVAQGLAVNLNTTAISTGSLSASICWTEE
jgi:hypothetical protein